MEIPSLGLPSHFLDVAVYFSWEEWCLLDEAQKLLYCDVITLTQCLGIVSLFIGLSYCTTLSSSQAVPIPVAPKPYKEGDQDSHKTEIPPFLVPDQVTSMPPILLPSCG
uniref:KRAB domain-containing protein n=1 Tax=Spermophilus dauricus TaxID=99837 RepID=A0A8C9PJR7_SPEDA